MKEDQLPYCNQASHKIETTDEVPLNTKQFRISPTHRQFVQQQVKKDLEQGVIEPSISNWNSPVIVVPKKPDAEGNLRYRMVIDYRNLNAKTVQDSYPLSNTDDILDQLGDSEYCSIFDLAMGFNQIPMDPKSAEKTAFSTPYGHYQYKKMPFGLRNAPATFQRMMDRVLSGLQEVEMLVYMDDIIVYAKDLEDFNQ